MVTRQGITKRKKNTGASGPQAEMNPCLQMEIKKEYNDRYNNTQSCTG